MAFHRHIIDLVWDIEPADTVPVSAPQPRLRLDWDLGGDGRLRSRWTHTRD